MNYKVMQRPMFKMGGKAASQGTGITSGLDERVNYSNGAFGTGRSIEDLKGMDLADLMALQTAGYDKSMQGLSDMRDIVKLQTLGNLATNVLPNIERGGLKGVVDFFQDPMTTQQAITGLTGLKKVDLKEKELQGKGLDKFISGQIGLEKLDIERAKANRKTATEIKNDFAMRAEGLKVDGVVPADKMGEYERLMKIALGSGFITMQEAKKYAIGQVLAMDPSENPKLLTEKGQKELIESIASSLYYFQQPEQNADGGRVGRMMGSSMFGEKPSAEEAVTQQQIDAMNVEKKDVAMETRGQGPAGQDAYAMLRARLPQEIPDDVVKLIAYNKQAFADFASIKNQEDVTSFNEKYNVSMNIDVSTV